MLDTTLFLLLALSHADNVDDDSTPVTKVIGILKQMRETLEQEMEVDGEVYDKFAGWCTTNEQEKKVSIKASKDQIDLLATNIKEYVATARRLETELNILEDEVDKNQRAFDTATAIRNKEVTDMHAKEKDLVKSIHSLESAIIAVGKQHHSLLEEESLEEVAVLLAHSLKRHPDAVQAALTMSQQHVVTSLMQRPGEILRQLSQSGQIFGILRSMKDKFEANLIAIKQAKIDAQKAFDRLKLSKSDEIISKQDEIHSKNEKLSTTKLAYAEAKQNLQDTQGSFAADQAYLADLQVRCEAMEKEWEQRQVSRQEELRAVNEAIQILNADDAQNHFSATIKASSNPSFLQLANSEDKKEQRSQAAAILSRVAAKVASPRISKLVLTVRMEAFHKVEKAIEDMIAQLVVEKKDEIQHKNWCLAALRQSRLAWEQSQRNVEDLTATVDALDAEESQLKRDVQQMQEEVKEIKIQIQRAAETRIEQNKMFQASITDQEKTRSLLRRAYHILKDVFEHYEKARFAELEKKNYRPAGPLPLSVFRTYEKKSNSNAVMAMLRTIMDDAAALEAETVKDEGDAQESYESFIQESQKSLAAKTKAIVNKQEMRGNKQLERAEHNATRGTEEDKLEALGSEDKDVHGSCDFVLNNFDLRQQARNEEIEALRSAKTILHGPSMNSFLQRS